MTFEEKVKLKSQVYEIMDLVLEGNGYEKRQRELTGNLPTFFVYYSGHVNTLTVDIHADGWESGYGRDAGYEFSLDHVLEEKELEPFRKTVKESLVHRDDVEILRREIIRREEKILDEKKSIAILKRTLKKKKEKLNGNGHHEEQPM